ncbi:Proline utilization trans-activator [Colletotrichum siamense]|nr:Proline utilization trans-activator [Colletotrichum siamense]
MKVRCSGTVPCTRCEKKKESCYFRPEETRITVSESYLRALETRTGRPRESLRHSARGLSVRRPGDLFQASVLSPPQSTDSSGQLDGQPTQNYGCIGGSARDHDHANPEDERLLHRDEQPLESGPTCVRPSANEFETNPLVNDGESFALDSYGKYWFMGPTSSWAFCRRVLAAIGSHTPDPEPPLRPWDLETLNLTWNPIGLNEQPDVESLPSYEYVVFNLAAVKYHLGPFSEIIDYDEFDQRLKQFYESPVTEAKHARYWYSQLLFVLAFGEAFNSTGTSKSVPGVGYASRALSLLPTMIPMEKEPLRAAEALCLGALYLQALDLRLMSFQLIGQALRICVLDGMHRHMPPQQVEPRHAQRCNTVFWSAYIIDREFSTLVGAPSSIRDEDITTKLPTEIANTAGAAALELHIQLSRLTARILNGVYGVDRNFDGSLVTETQSVLRLLAMVSINLSSYMSTTLRGADVKTSKVATRLVLSYHHCVVLTTRPLVMCVLQKRLATGSNDKSIPDGPISSLLQTCVASAVNTLKALKALGDDNLLDCFLPFQLEAAWSSAFLLKVLEVLSSGLVPDQSYLAEAHYIFDIMNQRGSPAAKLRKCDFERLEQLVSSFLGTPSQGNNEYPEEHLSSQENSSEQANAEGSHNIDPVESLQWDLFDKESGFALSPTELMDLAESLHMEDFFVARQEEDD